MFGRALRATRTLPPRPRRIPSAPSLSLSITATLAAAVRAARSASVSLSTHIDAGAIVVDIHVSQSGSGTQDGSSPDNARSVSWLNNSANWGAGAGQVGAGKVVQLVGTITSDITLQGSGTSGNYITIDGGTATISCTFETNGKSWWKIQNMAYSSGRGNIVSINGGSNGIYQGCTADNVNSGAVIWLGQPSGVRPDNILIKNNWVRTATTDIGDIESDIIKCEGATNVTVDGNYLELRIGGAGADAHDDCIQIYKSGAGGALPPANWTVKNNWFVMNSVGWTADRSWFMWQGMEGTNYIYRNVFLGIAGAEGANGISISRNPSGVVFNIYQNTFVCKNSASNNIMSFDTAGNTMNVRGNIIYAAGNQTMLITGTATVNRSYNQWSGAQAPSVGTNGEQSGNPLFTDYANNDFSLQAGSPAKNSGSTFGVPYDVSLLPGATWPGPATSSPSGTWDRGAFE